MSDIETKTNDPVYVTEALIAEDIDAYLDQHQHKTMLRFITCGSVDDGKSTLIGRLLYDSKMIFEDQLAALEADSKRVGTQGQEIDFALLVDGHGLGAAVAEHAPAGLRLVRIRGQRRGQRGQQQQRFCGPEAHDRGLLQGEPSLYGDGDREALGSGAARAVRGGAAQLGRATAMEK